MALKLRLIRRVGDLRPLVERWRELAGGLLFREPAWLLSWWESYGRWYVGDPPQRRPRARKLFVISVVRNGRVVALAPWNLEPSYLWGRVIRQLGSGEVCSDYQTLLIDPAEAAAGTEGEVISAVARYLVRELRGHWDRMDLDSVASDDAYLKRLVIELEAHGAQVERRPAPSCWRLALPATYEEYLGLLSKSHRKQLRRLARDVLDTPRARWHTVRTADDFAVAWPIFVELHQRRRRSLGERGCFHSPCFLTFHEDVARSLLARGELRLHWLGLDGRPLAAEYHFARGDTVFAYQSGVDPDRLAEEPGRLAGIAVVRQAIDDGYRVYDLLRGDEPYKAHWRAEPATNERISLVGPRRRSRARHAIHNFLRRMKRTVVRPETAASGPSPATPTSDVPIMQSDRDPVAEEHEYARELGAGAQ